MFFFSVTFIDLIVWVLNHVCMDVHTYVNRFFAWWIFMQARYDDDDLSIFGGGYIPFAGALLRNVKNNFVQDWNSHF